MPPKQRKRKAPSMSVANPQQRRMHDFFVPVNPLPPSTVVSSLSDPSQGEVDEDDNASSREEQPPVEKNEGSTSFRQSLITPTVLPCPPSEITSSAQDGSSTASKLAPSVQAAQRYFAEFGSDPPPEMFAARSQSTEETPHSGPQPSPRSIEDIFRSFSPRTRNPTPRPSPIRNHSNISGKKTTSPLGRTEPQEPYPASGSANSRRDDLPSDILSSGVQTMKIHPNQTNQSTPVVEKQKSSEPIANRSAPSRDTIMFGDEADNMLDNVADNTADDIVDNVTVNVVGANPVANVMAARGFVIHRDPITTQPDAYNDYGGDWGFDDMDADDADAASESSSSSSSSASESNVADDDPVDDYIMGDGDSALDDASDEDAMTVAENNRELAVDMLIEMFSGPGFACTDEHHQGIEAQHNGVGHDNHYGLSATYCSEQLDLSIQPQDIGLYSSKFLEPQGYSRNSYTPATTFRAIFEGTDAPDGPIKNVCLHVEHDDVPELQPTLRFDMDSLLAFPRSLAAFRTGLNWVPAVDVNRQITTNLHVSYRVRYQDADGKEHRRLLSLHQIPHHYIGSIGDGRYQCYLFFPRNVDPEKPTSFVKHELLELLFDKVLSPTWKKIERGDRFQYLPSTFQAAEAAAYSRGREHGTVDGERGRKRYAVFPILTENREAADEAWRDILHLVNTEPELARLQDMFLFVNAKGMKLHHKSDKDIYRSIDHFAEEISRVFDQRYVSDSEIIVDVGQEVCPPNPPETQTDEEAEEESVVFLLRTCCLEQQHAHFQERFFNGRKGTVNFFTNSFLRDTSNMTLVPPKRSQVYQGGLLYMQFYNTAKTFGDAQSNYLFSNAKLKGLAVDKAVWSASHRTATGTQVKAREQLRQNFISAKSRAREVYARAARKSTSTRREARGKLSVWKALAARRHQPAVSAVADAFEIILPEIPTNVWAVPTKNYVEFMAGNYHKLLSLLETIMVTSPSTGTTLERTKLMVTVIKCIQQFENCTPSRDLVLWIDEEEEDDKTLRGLGFSKSLTRNGFAWFGSVVDWETLTFRPEISDMMVGADGGLRGWYHTAGRVIQDTSQIMDECFDRLRRPDVSKNQRHEIRSVLAHICMRQYRRDVLKAIAQQRQGPEEHNTHLWQDQVVFSYESIKSTFLEKPHCASGNRTSHALSDADWLIHWIFGTGAFSPRHTTPQQVYPIKNRKSFENMPFRELFRKVKEIYSTHGDGVDWMEYFMDTFWYYHALIPYPNGNGTLISTASSPKGRAKKNAPQKNPRQWYLVKRMKVNNILRWWRAKDEEHPLTVKRLRRYPTTLDMTLQQLKTHLDGLH